MVKAMVKTATTLKTLESEQLLGMSLAQESGQGGDLSKDILESVEEINREGRCATLKDVWAKVEGRRPEVSEAAVAKELVRLSKLGKVLRSKQGRRGAKAYYAVPAYAYLLDVCNRLYVPREHILNEVAEGLRILGALRTSQLGEETEIDVDREKRMLALIALAHVLRGARFAQLREILDKAVEADKTNGQEFIGLKLTKIKDYVERFQREALTEALRLKYTSSAESLSSSAIGTCHICGRPLSDKEWERVWDWLNTILSAVKISEGLVAIWRAQIEAQSEK